MDHETAPLPEKSGEPLGRRGRAELPVHLHLERGGEALHRQLARELRDAMSRGALPPGLPLPSSRALAASLRISRGAVVEAYAELAAEGYVVGRHGSGTRVAPDLRPPAAAPRGPDPAQPRRWLRPARPPALTDPPPAAGIIDFRLGRPSLRDLDAAAWRAAWRAVARETPPDDYGEPAGEIELRSALAAYLHRSRGLHVDAAELLVTGGTTQAIALLARTLIRPGDRVAFEEPGYRLGRQLMCEQGAVILPVPVDEDGLQVQQLPEGSEAPLLLYCTPSHQYPLGGRLPVARRAALIDWARRNDVLILEDDYDGEFRYDADPLPTLASLAPHHVAYLGTLSKVLTPAVRVGYVVPPAGLLGPLVREKALTDWQAPWPMQRALTHFIAEGHLERHVRRARRAYARQRELLERALRPAQPHARLTGIQAGLHACLELDAHVNAQGVAAECRRRGVLVSVLDDSYGPGGARNALLLGYGGLPREQLLRGAAVLCQVIAERAGGREGR